MLSTVEVFKIKNYRFLHIVSVIFATSYGAITIREAQNAGMPSLYIIAGRLWLTTLILTPFILRNHWSAISNLEPAHWRRILLIGLILALNLIALFYAIDYTSVVIAILLRRTSSIFLAGLEVLLLGALFTRRLYIAVGLVTLGSMVVVLGENGASFEGASPVLGAIIALAGAVAMSFYMLGGRSMTGILPSLPYSWLLFLIAAVATTIAVLVSNIPLTGYTRTAYFWLIIVTIVNQFFGHIQINEAVRHFPATVVSIFMNAAVIISGIIAFFRFGEIPTPLQMIGGIIVLAGVLFLQLSPSNE